MHSGGASQTLRLTNEISYALEIYKGSAAEIYSW